MRIRPLGDSVFVKPRLIAEEGKRSSGILVAENRRQGIPKWGTIISLGPDVKEKWPHVSIEVGDKVIFKSKESFKVYTFDGEDYTILKPDEIFAKVDRFNDGFDE